MDISEQEHAYLVQALGHRPLMEALPLFLKLTGQKLVPNVDKPGEVTPISKGSVIGGGKQE